MRSEFDFIQNIKQKYSLGRVGDDCAVLPKDAEIDLLVTADLLVENVDFRLEWTTPECLGHKSLAVSLSDIAAMGGKPVWSMLSVGVPEYLWKTDFIDKFYEGWFALAREYGVELIGGDVSRAPESLIIDSIVGGEVGKGRAIMRSTARPGDTIFVSGSLGAAAGGLKLLENGSRFTANSFDSTNNLLLKQLKLQPQIMLAKQLYSLDIVTSMIDVSDGLSSDLAHICEESGVGATIDAGRIPIDGNLNEYFPPDECLSMALNGGEDFELLFTVAEKNISLLETLDISRIGKITGNVGSIELITDKKSTVLQPKGYRHF